MLSFYCCNYVRNSDSRVRIHCLCFSSESAIISWYRNLCKIGMQPLSAEVTLCVLRNDGIYHRDSSYSPKRIKVYSGDYILTDNISIFED